MQMTPKTALNDDRHVGSTISLCGREYPQHIKYMGSKAKIINFVIKGIDRVHKNGPICDLFAGACNLSGALGNQNAIISNDIQSYSGSLAATYLHRLSEDALSISSETICKTASKFVDERWDPYSKKLYRNAPTSLAEFNKNEKREQNLVYEEFKDSHHLFFKNYSGTWWSAYQCAWIDALRKVADLNLASKKFSKTDHQIFLACVMHAMAYTSQGTGHYAQYRDAKTNSSMKDIHIYRRKSISEYLTRKWNSLKIWNHKSCSVDFEHIVSTEDYVQCLETVKGGTVYADPPYAFVHYSRFYHAIETFALYDYPNLQVKNGKIVKGRYRENRHQSPFSIRTQVPDAFKKLFEGVANANANLVLSYSNTALLNIDELIELAKNELSKDYEIQTMVMKHKHMTMGRLADKARDVKEVLVLAEKIR